MAYYSNPENFSLAIGPKFYSGKNFDATTLITLLEAPYIEFPTPTTILSVEIPLNTCVTFFDGPVYTGNTKTFCKNSIDLSAETGAFTQVKCYIIQYSLVPYIDLGRKSYPNLPITLYTNKFFGGTQYSYLPGVYENLSINVGSIQIIEGTKVELTDDQNNTETFYHHVHFIDALGTITSSSKITKVVVTLLNTCTPIPMRCSINDDIENFMSSPALYTFVGLMLGSFLILLSNSE